MTPVEFQAKVENGAIAVPEEYRQQLGDGDSVKVIVLKPQTQPWSEFSHQFNLALMDAGYDSQEKIIDLVQEVKREMAAERDQRLAAKAAAMQAGGLES
jgi:hypothetical protein